MDNFFWLVLGVYAFVSASFLVVNDVERYYLCKCDFSRLKTSNALIDRVFLLMLDKYKYLPPRKKREGYSAARKVSYYTYYSKKVYKYLMLLAIPWLVAVYIMDWHMIIGFVKWHIVFSMIIGSLPAAIIKIVITLYEVRSYLIKKKSNNSI